MLYLMMKNNVFQIGFAQTLKNNDLVKSHIYPVLSFLRKQESSYFNVFWTPAFAGVTIFLLFTKPSRTSKY
jgi:hypothetical protein